MLQEGENNVALSSKIIACENSSKGLNPKVASASTSEDVLNDIANKAQLVITQSHDPHPKVASASTSEDVSNDVANKAQLVITQSHDPSMQIVSAVGEIASAAGALKVDGENLSLVMSSKYPFENELMDHDSVVIPIDNSQDVLDITSKPRMALFQGRENNESMAPQNIPARNSCVVSNMIARMAA